MSEQVSFVLLEFLALLIRCNQQSSSIQNHEKRCCWILSEHCLVQALRDATTVVIIEDLHWIDAASEEFVEALADAVVGTTTLLVVNFRPGFVAPLMQRSHYRQINMPPLPPAQAAILLQDHFGNDPSLALLSRNIVERAQGNPFFLEELVNALVERGDFEGEKGAYRLKGGIDTIPLPSTVQAVVAARIDRLEENAKQVLEIASVVGREISISILDAGRGLGSSRAIGSSPAFEAAELLYDVPPFEQRLLAFRHPLIQEVAYRSLLHERRRELHSKVAQAIESSVQGSRRGAGVSVGVSPGASWRKSQSGSTEYAGRGLDRHERSKSGAEKLEEGPRAVVGSATVSADRLLEDDGFRSNRKFCLARRNLGARCSQSTSRKPNNWR